MLSRRNLLKGATAAVVTTGAALQGLLPVSLAELARRPATEKVWHLSPRYPCRRLGEDPPGGQAKGCLACNACRSHARNKLFATKKAARRNRAHLACNCVVFSVVTSRRRYRRLFGFPACAGQGRMVFDKRTDTLYDRCTTPQ